MQTQGLVLLFLSAYASSVLAAPVFSDLPVAIYQGPTAKVRLNDLKSRQYAARLRAASHGKVNFAGNQILTMWGCGAACITAAAVDARTGAVAWLPFTVCCWNMRIIEPLEFRADSRLLIVHGSLNETGAGSAVHYYTFDGKKFSAVLSPGETDHD